MGGWMDVKIDGWMDGWMDRYTDEFIDFREKSNGNQLKQRNPVYTYTA